MQHYAAANLLLCLAANTPPLQHISTNEELPSYKTPTMFGNLFVAERQYRVKKILATKRSRVVFSNKEGKRAESTEKLRGAKLAAGVVTIFINTNRFSAEPQYGNSITYELAYSTDSTKELLEWALKGLERIYRAGYKYKRPE